MFDGDDGVQSEIVSEVVPHGDAGSDGGVATKIATAGWEDSFNLCGEEETIGIDEKRTWDDGEIAKTFCGTDAFFVFKNIRHFNDDSESLGECPLEFDFGFMFGEALSLHISLVDEQIATCESRLDAEGVNVGCAVLAGVKVGEGSQEIRCEGTR